MGEAFPFASPTEHIDTQTHFSLHEWIISFGDRLGCKQWLAAYFSHRVGKHWTSVPDADLLDTLLHCQKHGQTLNEAIQQESDLEMLHFSGKPNFFRPMGLNGNDMQQSETQLPPPNSRDVRDVMLVNDRNALTTRNANGN